MVLVEPNALVTSGPKRCRVRVMVLVQVVVVQVHDWGVRQLVQPRVPVPGALVQVVPVVATAAATAAAAAAAAAAASSRGAVYGPVNRSHMMNS